MKAAMRSGVFGLIGIVALFVAVQGFVWHSAERGVLGLLGNVEAQGRLAATRLGNGFIFGHMVMGAVVTLLAVVQATGTVRRRWPVVHRWSGRVLAVSAFATGVGGLGYILLHGTIGGPLMSVGFGLYGVLMILCAVQAPRFAVARDYARHRRWGLRLIVLALGSWIYRVHYGLWYGTTCTIGPEVCGLGARPDFSGPFDIIQMFAFFLPYLLVLEWILRRELKDAMD